jgi:glycerate kinase
MRIVVVVDALGPALGAAEAAAAITEGWRVAAPDDELRVLAPGDADLGPALDGAALVVTGGPRFDWEALRDSLATTVAGMAVERGVPCVVVAGQVSVGRREAAAVGVDAAYALDGPAAAGDASAEAAALAALVGRVARRWSR